MNNFTNLSRDYTIKYMITFIGFYQKPKVALRKASAHNII